jgi:prepilin-type N-terminal cleavage/methylation domain-containing protein
MRQVRANRNAFTLIELMVVISIIAILIGLLFPALRGVQDQAKRAQAKNEVSQIVTAVNAYYTEYGKYPVVTDDTPIANTADLFYTLRAINLGTANAGDAANPRKIVFISPPDVKDAASPRSGIGTTTGVGQWYDPWGTIYKVAIDGTYDNQIANPYPDIDGSAGANPLRIGVIVWSYGSDRTQGSSASPNYKGSDDVISWQ